MAAMKQPLSVAAKKQFYMLTKERAWKTRVSQAEVILFHKESSGFQELYAHGDNCVYFFSKAYMK